MLKTFRLHNFKTFLNTEVSFAQRHLVIGRNGSGKTNLVRALQFLGASARGELSRANAFVPGGIAEICNWHLRSEEFEIGCTCQLDFQQESYEYVYNLKIARRTPGAPLAGKEVGLEVLHERLAISGNGHQALVILDNDGHEAKLAHEEQAMEGRPDPYLAKTRAPQNATMLSKLYELDTNRRMIHFRNYLNKWLCYSISPWAMRKGPLQASASQGIALDEYGEQIANAIFHLKNVDERRYRRLIEHARIVEPALQAILFIPVPDRAPVPFVDLDVQQRASWFGLSDGTLRALALGFIIEYASALSSPPASPQACLTIIEEPENGISPGLVRKFFDLFEEWAPTAQFIFTSHSPSFIDMFDYERDAVTVLKRSTDRSEIVKPPQPEESEDRLTLSEEYASELFP